MRKLTAPRMWMVGIGSVLLSASFAIPASGQEASWEEADTAVVGPPTLEEPAWTTEAPSPTARQRARLEYWLDQTHLPGPPRYRREPKSLLAGPEPGTESVLKRSSKSASAAPRDAVVFRKTKFGGVIPGGFISNVMEGSVGVAGKFAFYTGNWFAARSTDGGATWKHIDPFKGFPDFCCDQITIYDESRDIFMWLRMGIPATNPATGNFENVFKLSVSTDGGATFCTYTRKPTKIKSGWTNQWWDYPHIQLGADFVYIAWNMFGEDFFWVRTVMLRWPLNKLAACAGFSFKLFKTSAWFTIVPVQGAHHIMYWASNFPMTSPFDRIGIWKWAEDSSSISHVSRDVALWKFTGRGDAKCGSSAGNWLARSDDRLLTGARYSIHNKDLKVPGLKVLAWWWNVAQGGSFPEPYIDGAAFYEDTLEQVSGAEGRPFVRSNSKCFGYPSAAANKRQDLGMVFHYAKGTAWKPRIAFTLSDDFTPAPPPWKFYTVQKSNARPDDNVWGDYNTVREFEPTQKVWVAAAHYIPKTTNCVRCSEPVYFVFGRERDRESYRRWKDK